MAPEKAPSGHLNPGQGPLMSLFSVFFVGTCLKCCLVISIHTKYKKNKTISTFVHISMRLFEVMFFEME